MPEKTPSELNRLRRENARLKETLKQAQRLRSLYDESVEKLEVAQQEIREKELLEAAILNAAMDCIISMDHEGRIAEFNVAAEKTFGYAQTEVLGKPLADVMIPPALREAHNQGLARCLSGKPGDWLGRRMETTGMRADGTEFPVELSITKISVNDSQLFTGFVRDITRRKQAEEAKQLIVEGVNATGEAFFPELVRCMAAAVEVDIAFCAEHQDGKARSLAIWTGEELVENLEWELAGTPCEGVRERKSVFIAEGVQARFPEDQWLAEVGAESYLGIPFMDIDGNVIGHMGLVHDKPMRERSRFEPILQIFCARAGAELERLHSEKAVKERMDEIERMNRLMVGRELKMEELRKEIRKLKNEINSLRLQ